MIFNNIDLVLVQTIAEADFYKQLADKIEIIKTGSIKYDLPEIKPSKVITDLTLLWQNRPIWIAASVHNVEFAAVLQAHQQVMQRFPNALLLIFPRKDHDFSACYQKIKSYGFTCSARSADDYHSNIQVFLGDCIGELQQFYYVSHVAFIGGSLFPKGGHNPLEAAMAKIPTIMGKYQYNCTDICQRLQLVGNLTTITNTDELADTVIKYLGSKADSEQSGLNGFNLIKLNQGATMHHYNIITTVLG